MSRDLLAQATRALRSEGAKQMQEGDATRARLERALLERAPVRKKMWRTFAFAIAATFVVTGAWAQVSGKVSLWPTTMKPPFDMSLSSQTEAKVAPGFANRNANAEGLERAAPNAEPLATLPPAQSELEPTPQPPSQPTSQPKMAASARPAPATSSSSSSPWVRGAEDPDALYRVAHEAHFVRRDPSAALAAWDHYLQVAGATGRFSLEARYNRGVSLVRLRQFGLARAALKPFADGEYGGYRRDEARALMDQLE